jgi:hypothetical protein
MNGRAEVTSMNMAAFTPFSVTCKVCGITALESKTQQGAIDNWNSAQRLATEKKE